MPDWFYRTVSQPILFRLPAPRARDFALGFIGRLARLPLGPFLIDFLGHMRADPRLRRSLLDTDFPTAVGLGPWLDTRLVATEALSRFGVGFIEVGPVSVEGSPSDESVRRIVDQQGLWIGPDAGSISLAELNRRLSKAVGLKVPLIVRLGHGSDEAIQRLLRELPASVRLVSLTTLATAVESGWSIERWSEHLELVLKAALPRHILLCINADQDLDAAPARPRAPFAPSRLCPRELRPALPAWPRASGRPRRTSADRASRSRTPARAVRRDRAIVPAAAARSAAAQPGPSGCRRTPRALTNRAAWQMHRAFPRS